MPTCSECEFYETIDETKGFCKQSHAERHVTQGYGETAPEGIINGWPEVQPDDGSCGEYAQG